jgi:hypothetical protein
VKVFVGLRRMGFWSGDAISLSAHVMSIFLILLSLRSKRASLEAIKQTPWSREHLRKKKERINNETDMLRMWDTIRN